MYVIVNFMQINPLHALPSAKSTNLLNMFTGVVYSQWFLDILPNQAWAAKLAA